MHLSHSNRATLRVSRTTHRRYNQLSPCNEHDMKVHIIISMMTLALVSVTSPLLAGEGKALYEKNCIRCHSTEVFTREDRGIKNYEALKTRVQQCTGAAEVKWVDEEIKNVADYLNKNFYKF